MSYQICNRCICDTSIENIKFNSDGICSFCELHDELEKIYPLNSEGEQKLNKIIAQIKADGKDKRYDCVLGVSGGRDSMYTLHNLVTKFKLRPLAVHFNDGFGNPIAGENMRKATKKLGVDLITITSDWRESKDLKIAFLKASTPDMEEGTDIGIATALYGAANKYNLKYIVIGQSFRTEGIAPLSWNFLDGKYLKNVHKKFGTVPLRKWTPDDPGFNLDIKEMLYYTVYKRIKTFPVLYYQNYVREDVDSLLEKELDWKNPGAHYFDDLYQSLMTKILREKFKIDRRIFNYSALVRSGQMARESALEKVKTKYSIEDPKTIELCIKRLGITEAELNEYVARKPLTFKDYKTNYRLIKLARPAIWLFAYLNLLPKTAYHKYFKCG